MTLSPVVTGELLGMLDRALGNGRQIIATTHSPYVIRWGIENDAEVRQVRPDFGTRSWKECLHQQGIDPSSIHSQTSPIDVGKCCALLETYLTA